MLVPPLRAGDIVIIYNLGAHKNDHTPALIAQAGADVGFLQACSPDLNPIEMMWSKVKSLLRKAGLARNAMSFWRLLPFPSPSPLKMPSADFPPAGIVKFETL